MTEFKSLYSQFLSARTNELHFAAHSHHFWPDITREAQLQAWDDAARFNDRKWEHIFAHVIPKVQGHIARLLNLKRPEMIALAPNTHDLVVRLFSQLLSNQNSVRLLTTDSEFYSFARQLKRFQEAYPDLQVTQLPADKLLNDRAQFLSDFRSQVSSHNVVFISQVFFNSGLALSDLELKELVAAAPEETIFIIDGYHAFAAVPTDLAALEGRIFYLGGGYKYAQAGEGVGFMVVPTGNWRPVITGWLAEFAQLSSHRPGTVGYSQDGMAFWGATMDPSGWYRFNAVWDQFQRLSVGVTQIHQYVVNLQTSFLATLPARLKSLQLLHCPGQLHGHFLTFQAADPQQAIELQSQWQKRGLYVDVRGSRVRFGFGLYQDQNDIKKLTQLLT